MNIPWLQLVFGGLIAVMSSSLGWWAAVRLQERADVKRVRNAARALLQDLRRIHESLCVSTTQSLADQSDSIPIVPRVHPWLHALVPELASLSGDAVRRFLMLDEHLTRREALVARYIEVNGAFLQSADLGDNYRRWISENDSNRATYEIELRRIEQSLPRLEAQFISESRRYDVADAALRENLGLLERLLADVAELPLPDLLPVVNEARAF